MLLLGVYVLVYWFYVELEREKMFIDVVDYVIVEVWCWLSVLKLRRKCCYKLLERKIFGWRREELNLNKEDELVIEKGIIVELGNR